MSDYSSIKPIETAIPADRQGAKRHYGVHPYFTRRPFNVVRRYILHYSRQGDAVLDPFGGSGVTAIEAFLENRIGIQNDINPMANFIAKGIVDLSMGELREFASALDFLEDRCAARLMEIQGMTERTLRDISTKVLLPANVRLPKNSDAETFHELFSLDQLVELALLKEQIEGLTSAPVRSAMFDFMELLRRKGWRYDQSSFCWVTGQQAEKPLFS